MIDVPGWFPRRGAVAVLADVCRVDMTRVFSFNIDIVVAAEAVPADIGVIEDGRNPKRAVVAIVALIARHNVAGWFAGCDRAVVASAATA
ncbi:MAG: hypothetical protein EX272_06360 [Chromatiales bacterium]|nr:MAG: hypothetical protein EX272_06360 [Chromatiales bacterium]